MEKIEDIILPTSTISALLGISSARMSQLWKTGIISAPIKRGEYSAVVVTQYVEWLRDKARGRTEKNSTQDEERTRLIAAQADKIERENAIEEREVIKFAEVVETLQHISRQAVAILEALPLNIKRRVPALKARDIEYIKLEIAKSRNLIAKIELNG